MKLSIELTKLKPDNEQNPTYWDVGFTITHENFVTRYVPVTVYAHKLAVINKASIIDAAARLVLPGQIALIYTQESEED